MERKYVVWMEGKPLEIVEGDPGAVLREHWLVVNVHEDQEITPALAALERPEVAGVRLYSSSGLSVWDAFRARYRFVPAAGGAVDDERGRLLVIRRLGKWDLPKGKVEESEGVEEAAVREVQEECGVHGIRLIAPLTATWHTYHRKGADHLKRTDWYLMRASSLEPLTAQAEEGIEEVRWAEREELPALMRDTYPSLRPVFEAWAALRR